MMDDETRTGGATGLVDPQGRPTQPVAASVACEGCGAASERFAPVFGGQEVCMACGHQREKRGAPRG